MPQLADVLKAEFGMQPYTVRLIRVNCCDDSVVTQYASKPDEFLENKGADAVSMPVRVDVNGILDSVAVSGPAVIRGKRAPADNLCIPFRDNYRVIRTLVMKPLKAPAVRFGFFLIGTGGMQHIMIVYVINGIQIWLCCRAQLRYYFLVMCHNLFEYVLGTARRQELALLNSAQALLRIILPELGVRGSSSE